MQKSIFASQSEFLMAGEVPHPTIDSEAIKNAAGLIHEEYTEWNAEKGTFASKEANLNELKEVIDLIYVCAQYLNQCVGSTNAQLLFDAVHKNNMDKCIDGKLVKDPDTGKILKPEGFDKMAWEIPFQIITGQLRRGGNGYAEYFHKGTWRESAKISNQKFDELQAALKAR